ncbi:hypothetical protein [Pseudonocardia asaccharolytica]|uniref:Scaffolding protein n=1 Tax=Pseudonocardia asaccharolytica DSM 44247 = NBRC 16224 TaxID=1123024 RepID=A0A511D4E9_9PSEU|nr:hypothetical protein [Pseudonocardia asaccharolytica]GEL19353.1 hypothetical protein PA7_31900 [Pseudonocardia asaccharolytica DSM 44247 = NBRC 16224]
MSDDNTTPTPPAGDGGGTTPPNGGAAPGKPDTGGEPDWQAKVAAAEREVEKWKSLARKHEGNAKANADAASKAKTVEQQLEELRAQLAERDEQDLVRNGRLAKAQVRTKLAEAGIRGDAAAGLLDLVDAAALLRDGEPDDKAIAKFADSLTKLTGQAVPDPDQGRRGGEAPADMNNLIRRAAGIKTS